MGKNLFEQTLNVDRTEINFNKVKENKINQSSISNNPFLNKTMSPNDNLANQKVKNVNITLYENDILKIKFITQITGAKLSSFVIKHNHVFFQAKNLLQ